VAPFAVFIGLTTLESQSWLGVPYEALYALKVVVVSGLLLFFRREYPPFSRSGFGLAALAGIAGFGLWIALDALQQMIPGLPALVSQVFGSRAGFNPWEGERSSLIRLLFVGVRLVGLVAIVPVMEEIFWRGFLARYLISDDFRSVPQGKFTQFSFAVVTLAFASVHPEILAAVAWGALINLVYARTANVWACVVMHATTNGLLGVYILSTGHWALW
jgi:CAAX prenyl protease-like protein